MGRSVSAEELEVLIKRQAAVREQIKKDPKEARRLLCAAGITDENGKLTKYYRLPEEGEDDDF